MASFQRPEYKGWLRVDKVDTAKNWSDIFTKVLAGPQFEKLRDEMMGWVKVNQLTWKDSPVDAPKLPDKLIDLYNPFERNSPCAVAALACAPPNKKRKASSLSNLAQVKHAGRKKNNIKFLTPKFDRFKNKWT